MSSPLTILRSQQWSFSLTPSPSFSKFFPQPFIFCFSPMNSFYHSFFPILSICPNHLISTYTFIPFSQSLNYYLHFPAIQDIWQNNPFKLSHFWFCRHSPLFPNSPWSLYSFFYLIVHLLPWIPLQRNSHTQIMKLHPLFQYFTSANNLSTS